MSYMYHPLMSPPPGRRAHTRLKPSSATAMLPAHPLKRAGPTVMHSCWSSCIGRNLEVECRRSLTGACQAPSVGSQRCGVRLRLRKCVRADWPGAATHQPRTAAGLPVASGGGCGSTAKASKVQGSQRSRSAASPRTPSGLLLYPDRSLACSNARGQADTHTTHTRHTHTGTHTHVRREHRLT